MEHNNTLNNSEYILEARGISKTFPGVKALSNVNLKLKKGEVLALVGENGAGKSTISKIICGVYQPDKDSEGMLLLDGKPVKYYNAAQARADGIMMIFQELSLVLDLTVAENMFLNNLPLKRGKVDWKKLFADAKEVMDKIECNIDPRETVRNLTIADQQMVEISRAVANNAKIVIFDEPTSSLSEKEKEVLFKNIRKMKQSGVAIMYISHRMSEILELTDRISVFRDGMNSGEFITQDTTIDQIVASMIGRDIGDYYHKSKATPGEEVLRVENLSSHSAFQDISFNVRQGEVVGLYGLVGAGRTEIVECIFGLRQITNGSIYYNKELLKHHSPKTSIKHKIGLIPENRKEQGLALHMTIKENMVLANLVNMRKKSGTINDKLSSGIYEEFQEKLSISCTGPNQKAISLSGGNQQKVVIGKWLALSPRLLILDEPTRGIDVGSKKQIHKLIADLAEQGLAVIVISSEMPEIIGVSNRVITIMHGKLTGEFSGDGITEENLINAVAIEDTDRVRVKEAG